MSVLAVRAILFDVGDTLVRLGPMERDLAPRLAAVLDAAGVACDGDSATEHCERMMVRLRGDILAGFEASRLEEHDIPAMLAAGLEAGGVTVASGVAADLADVLSRADIARIQPWPGVREELERFRADGYRLAAVSNTTSRSRLLQDFFDARGLTPCFDAWVFSVDLGVRKPHPAIYEHALATLDIPANEALFVGDRVREDIVGPRSAGIAHAILTHEHRQEDPGGSNPCAVITRFEDLHAILPTLH